MAICGDPPRSYCTYVALFSVARQNLKTEIRKWSSAGTVARVCTAARCNLIQKVNNHERSWLHTADKLDILGIVANVQSREAHVREFVFDTRARTASRVIDGVVLFSDGENLAPAYSVRAFEICHLETRRREHEKVTSTFKHILRG